MFTTARQTVPSPYYGVGATYQGRFAKNADELHEFHAFNRRWPKQLWLRRGRAEHCPTDHRRREHRLAKWLSHSRGKYDRGKLSTDEINRLRAIDDNIFDRPLVYEKVPSPLWRAVFKWAQSKTTWESVCSPRSFGYPSTKKAYIETASSFLEHMVMSTKVYKFFEPTACHPRAAQPGTMQHVMSYALYNYMKETEITPSLPPPSFKKNVVDTEPPLLHNNPGTFFPSKDMPPSINTLGDSIVPSDLIRRIKRCKTIFQYDQVMAEYEWFFDSFNYGKNGRYSSEIVNILDTKHPQPRRTAFSCTVHHPHYFASLGVFCLMLYAYNAAGRPRADSRCRPMTLELYNLGVSLWMHAHDNLAPLCQVCPPFNTQLLFYCEFHDHLYLHPVDCSCKGCNKKRSSLHTWRANKKKNKTKPPNSKSPHKKTPPPKKAQLKPKKTYKRKVFIYKSEMRFHHDNGVQDNNGFVNSSISTSLQSNSHIFGTDVLGYTIGDPMLYYLVRPNYENGETFKMPQKAAYTNYRANNNKNSEYYGKLATALTLDHGSLYIHSAHDDLMYYHGLQFPPNTTHTQVRFGVMYRWLSSLAYYRHNKHDFRGHRYGAIDKEAFDTLNTWDTKDRWYKAMGYIEEDGSNSITKHLY